jgi:hypothetical protein
MDTSFFCNADETAVCFGMEAPVTVERMRNWAMEGK